MNITTQTKLYLKQLINEYCYCDKDGVVMCEPCFIVRNLNTKTILKLVDNNFMTTNII